MLNVPPASIGTPAIPSITPGTTIPTESASAPNIETQTTSPVLSSAPPLFINHLYNGYEIGISDSDLDTTLKSLTYPVAFNPTEAYEALKDGDKKALGHLVRAAKVLDFIFLEQDHEANIPFKLALEEASKNGDEKAQRVLALFRIFNGIEGKNGISTEPLRLIKGQELKPGKNLFPPDITKQELVEYLKTNIHKAAGILSNDTIVRRSGKDFIATPYAIYFKDKYELAAKELLLAAKETTHEGFANYLRLQAQSMVAPSDPELSYKADVAWANLEDSPLEFTISRESYDDELTGQIASEPELASILRENKITVKRKDMIGIRVGINNTEITSSLKRYKDMLVDFSKLMPRQDEYTQSVNTGSEVKQTLSDIHLVAFAGDYASLRPSVSLAQNLPNGDKLSVQLGQGRRNVFHKEIRETHNPALRQKILDALVEPSFHELYSDKGEFLFVLMHELSHSLGPTTTLDGRDKQASLGEYGSIFEEIKADMGSHICNKHLKDTGEYTTEDLSKIYFSWTMRLLPITKPSINQAHQARAIMQLNYFIKHGAIIFNSGNKLTIDPNQMTITAQKMLEEAISIQLSGDESKAKEFADEYFQWGDNLERISQIRKSLSPKPLRILQMLLAEKLLA